MQYAILILLILAVILLLILIFRRSRDLIDAMEQQLSQAKDALLEQERLMQQEWSSGMHQNIRTKAAVCICRWHILFLSLNILFSLISALL